MRNLRELTKENKREHILKAAIDLFTRKGFEKTSVESITRKSKIAKGTFYNFFDKKEDVLLYFLDKEISKSVVEIERKMSAQKTIADKLELLIATYIKYIFPNKEFGKVLMKERVVKIGTGCNQNELNLVHTVSLLIDGSKQKGELKRSIDSQRMAEMIFAIYTMYVIYWINGFIKTKQQCVARISEVICLILNGAGKNRK